MTESSSQSTLKNAEPQTGGVTPEAPWLGLQSFTENVRDYFFGRDREIAELYERVLHRPLTILFGQSGLGKTSLLRAGVIPRLREEGYQPILIRLIHDPDIKDQPLEQQVLSEIAKVSAISPSVRSPETAPSLWQLFHDPEFGFVGGPNAKPTRPVIVFDQFEEIFTVGQSKRPADVDAFVESLSCLVENRPPREIRERLQTDDDLADRLLPAERPCRVVLTLREDFLHRLERWRQKMPSMMENRFELRLLSGSRAFDAVYKPGAKRAAADKPPIVSPATAESIVRLVAGKGSEVPLSEIDNVPPLLSLICEQLNARRLRENRTTLETEGVTGLAEEVLRNFCNQSFQTHPPAVREFVESRLISQSGFRASVNYETATAELLLAGVTAPEATLSDLVNQRLLTIEDRGGVRRVELTHDILAPVIRRARDEGLSDERMRQAQSIYDSLGDEVTRDRRQRLASRLFCELSEPSADGLHRRRSGKFTIGQAVREAVGSTANESDIEDMIFVISAFQAGGFLTLFPATPLTEATRVEVSSVSLLRQWSRLQVWIDTETKSALSYRRLMDEVRSGSPTLSDKHLDQAQEWLKHTHPNVHWAMRYDGATQPADSLFQQCLALIKSSHLARLAEEQATAQRDQEQLRDKAIAEKESQRAREAEAAAIHFRRQKKLALGACLVAVVCLGFALDNLRNARTATATAEKNERDARNAEEKEKSAKRAETKAKNEAIASRETAQKQQADAFSQNAKHYWRFAVNVRDEQAIPDAVKSSHFLLRAANSLAQIVPTQVTVADAKFIGVDGLAAHAVDRPVVRTWVHDASVVGCKVSRDESRVLTWSLDGTARIWDVNRPEPIQTFNHDSDVLGAQFSQDESRVLTWSADKTARLWDVTQSVPLQAFKHLDSVNGAQFNRDASRVLTWSSDHTARMWDVTKTGAIQTFQHDGAVQGAQFSRDESRVLTWATQRVSRRIVRQGAAWLWDVTMPEPLQVFKHNEFVNGAAFNNDESRVLTWSDDNTARLWDVTKPEPIQTFRHAGLVLGAKFSRDSSRVLTWSLIHQTEPESFETPTNEIGKVSVWDVRNADPIQVFHLDSKVNGAEFSRDELRVLTWSGDASRNKGQARLWDLTKAKPIQTFNHSCPVYGAQFSRDESRVLTWSADVGSNKGEAWLWDVTKSEPLQVFKHDGDVHGAQFIRDESHVLTWSSDGTARLWNVSKPKPLQTFNLDRDVNGAQFSRDGSRILSWSDDKTVRLWDVTLPEAIQTFKNDDTVFGVEFSRDASHVLTLSSDGMARLWDVAKPDPIRVFKHDDGVFGVEFGRDQSRVLTWSEDGTARFWDVTKPDPIRTFKLNGDFEGVEFSRDESRVLTWSYDNTARLWDVTKSVPLQTFKHDDSVIGLQFSQDESRVLTWSDDGTARLWDVTKPVPLQTFKHADSVNGAQFSRDESRVLTWSVDKTARLWNVTKPEPILTFKHAGDVVAAQFSVDEMRVLTLSGKSVWTWDVTDPLEVLTPSERILELEVRSGTTLDDQQNLRTLKFDEWQAKAKSPEYRAIEEKLAARTARPTQRVEATPGRPVGENVVAKSTNETVATAPLAVHDNASRPDTKRSPRAEVSPTNSTASSVSFTLLGYVGLIVLVVFGSKAFGPSQNKNKA